MASNLKDLNFRLTIDDVRSFTPKQQTDLKFRCRTDLRFLSNCVLRPNSPKKFPTLLESVHGPIIDSLLKPDPTKDSSEWDERDEFVTMASRGMLKSTIGAALLTQVIL